MLDAALSERGAPRGPRRSSPSSRSSGSIERQAGPRQLAAPRSGRYWFAVFGEPGGGVAVELADRRPSRGDPGRPSPAAQVIGSAPSFLGANPATVPGGPQAGRRAIDGEETLARALLAIAVSRTQREVAVVDPVAPPDILSGNGRRADLREIPTGIRYDQLEARPAGGPGASDPALPRPGRRRGRRCRMGADPCRRPGGGHVRLGRTGRTGPRPLLRDPRPEPADRIRQHAGRRQPHPRGLARPGQRLGRGPAGDALPRPRRAAKAQVRRPARHDLPVDDVRVGRLLRAIRRRRGLRQADVATTAGLSQQAISLIERGHLSTLSIRVLRDAFAAVDARFEAIVSWRGGQIDRLLDEGHAILVGHMANELARLGWEIQIEVTYSEFGERGSVDILAVQRASRAALVVEIKTELTAIDDTIRRLDVKCRLAPKLVHDRFDWQPVSISRLLVVLDRSTNRRRVARHAGSLDRAYPDRGLAVRRWLIVPSGRISGLTFVSPTNGSGARPRTIRSRSPSTPIGTPPTTRVGR